MNRLTKAINRATNPARTPEFKALQAQVATLAAGLEESRRLNERLSDVLDVVVELLVPATDRDDERLQAALAALDKKVPE